MTYRIRKGTEQDLPAIATIYDHIHTAEETGRAVIGWVRGVYPVPATARAALDAGELFVLEYRGQAAASARINRVQVPEYALGNWAWKAEPDRVMVLHTLAVEPALSGRGLGRAFVAFYEDYAAAAGCTVLRMDTNEKNAAARRLYAGLGYREAGIVPCDFNGIPGVSLVLLEKKLPLKEEGGA